MDTINWEVVSVSNSSLCTLFNRLFGEDPSKEVLDVFFDEGVQTSFKEYLAGIQDLRLERTWGTLQSLAAEYKSTPDVFIESRKSEYMKLFVGPASLVAPPWESVYVSREALLFQASTLDVRRHFKRFSFALDTTENVADDHISYEFGFLAVLANRLREDRTPEDKLVLMQEQHLFIRKHMLTWIDEFYSRIEKSEKSPFYACVALLAEHFLQAELGVLDDLIVMQGGQIVPVSQDETESQLSAAFGLHFDE